MPFILESSEGVQEFSDETLLVFIDETGHEDFPDEKVPFFGFGGCLCPVPTYPAWIDDPWTSVQEQFPEECAPLHAADLNPDALSSEQLSRLSEFFVQRQFQCFAAVASNQVMNETDEKLFHIMALGTYQRIVDLIQHIRGFSIERIVILFEHSERTDKMMMDYFRRYRFQKPGGGVVPVTYGTMTKKDELPAGLIVADFVAHTAGAQTRSRIRGASRFRRDFEDIFRTPDSNKSSFMEVTKISPAE